jgi:hypothetical protein
MRASDRFRFLSALVTLSASVAVGCGSSNGSTPSAVDAGPTGPVDSGLGSDASPNLSDGGTPNDGATASSGHLNLPTLTWGGAPLQTSAKVVSVFFPNDPMAPQLKTFGETLTTNSWWTSTVTQYCEGDGGACIGAGQAGVAVTLDAGAAAEYDDGADAGGVQLQPWLTDLISSGALPPADANTLYMLYIPPSTAVNYGGSLGCEAFDGYHGATAANVAYAVSMECPADPDAGLPAYTVSDVTLTASHETAESATDGLTDSNNDYGWYNNFNDPNNWAWNDDSDGEVADFCADYLDGQGTDGDYWPLGGFTYQRIWSVEAAAANQNPCLPVPAGEIYYNAAPQTAFLALNVGESITIPVTAFADGAHAAWNVDVFDSTDPTGATSYTKLAWEGSTATDPTFSGTPMISMSNGTVANLTITLTTDPSNVGNGNACADSTCQTTYGEADITIWSFDGTGLNTAKDDHYWELAVMTRASATAGQVTLLDGGAPEKRIHRRQRHLPNGLTVPQHATPSKAWLRRGRGRFSVLGF